MDSAHNGGSGCVTKGNQTLTVDLDQLLAGLAPSDPDGLWTSAELVDEWGMSRANVVKTLNRLQKAGRIKNGKKRMVDLAGQERLVPAYGFVMGGEE